MRKIDLIVVHHSATDAIKSTWKQIRKFHTDPPPQGRGWRDIGYHFGIVRNPGGYVTLVRGRPVEMVGAHCSGHNENSIGICIEGNFTLELPSSQTITMLTTILATLCVVYDLDPTAAIKGHRELAPTECPGANMDLDMIRQMVKHSMEADG